MSSPHKNLPGQGSESRQLALTNIALVFRRYGYEATTMSLLSEHTGLRRSSLYHHFPGGKEDMALSVLDYVERLLRDELLAALDPGAATSGQIDNFIQALDSYYEKGQLGCLLGSLSLRDCPESVASRVASIMHSWLEHMTRYLHALRHRDAQQRAERIVRNIQGGLVMSLATGNPVHFHSALKDIKCLFEISAKD